MGSQSFELPKYAQMVNAIQQRITDGTYAPGAAIPTEPQLGAEFGVSRTVVVRALGILQQDGWLDAEQGRGRFVRPQRARATNLGGPGREILTETVETEVTVLDVGIIDAPPGVSAALGLAKAARSLPGAGW
jgi:GntR family transcriptional regulator